MKPKAKCARRVLFIVILIAASALLCVFALTASETQRGHLRLSVVDAYTLTPLPGVHLTLPESGIEADTDAMGRADIPNVPICKDAVLEALLPQDSGRATILCTKQGYRPHALFYARVSPNTIRTLTLYLFPAEDTDAPTGMIEAPEEEWIARLLEKYTKMPR